MDGHRARRRFGQNFLHDPGVIARLLRFIDARPEQRLVEIGPGLGALTDGLVSAVKTLDVVEIDRDLIPRLRERFGDGVRIHEHDALRFDFTTLGTDELRVVGNLPYNISTPLMFHLLAQSGVIRDMHFMLQKEVVDRLCAEPGSRDYGRLSVSVAARAEARRLMRVGAGAFQPAPKVESAFVRLTPRRPDFPLPDPARFDRIVTAAFAQRRKTLSNALRGLLSPEQNRAAGIEPGDRAEVVSPAGFAALAAQHAADEPPPADA